MHSVRRINVPFPSPLSVREKMNESSVIGVKMLRCNTVSSCYQERRKIQLDTSGNGVYSISL